MLQCAPAARLVPHVFVNAKEEAFAPVTAMLLIDKAACPELVSVTDCDAVAVPTADDPNDRLVAESVTAGPSPVPLSLIDCGEVLALSVMVIAAVNAPPVAGAKCPWMVQFAPTARLVPQVLAKTNEEALAPVTAILPIVNAAVPEFVMVTDCEPLEEPTLTEPKERLVAESVTGAAIPVPLSLIDCGEVVALSVMVIAAVKAPAAAGAKCP